MTRTDFISQAHQQKEELLLSAAVAATVEDNTTTSAGKKANRAAVSPQDLYEAKFSLKHGLIFTLTNSMSTLALAIQELLGDQTDLIAGQMATTADLLGPLSQKWSEYFQAVLAHDNENVKGAKNDKLSFWVNQFNSDNTKNSGFQTGSGSISSMLAQKTSSNESNYGNLMQIAQKAVTDLAAAIVQDWVI